MTGVSLIGLLNGLIITMCLLTMRRNRRTMQKIRVSLRYNEQTTTALNNVFMSHLITVKEVSYMSQVEERNASCTKEYRLSCPRKTNMDEVLLQVNQLEHVEKTYWLEG